MQLAQVPCLVRGNQLQSVHHALRIFAGNVQSLHRAQPQPQKDKVELRFQRLQRRGRIHVHSAPELHAQPPDHLHLAHAVCGAQLVLRHAISVQPARQFAPLDHRRPRALAAQLRRARQRRRPAANARHAQLARPLPGHWHRFARRPERIHRVPLQQRNLDRLPILPVQHARTLAQHVHGAHPRAARAKNIRIQNPQRRPAQIARRNALDEPRHIDMRGARGRARRVETVQAAVGLNHRSLRRQRRLQLAKPRPQLLVVR